MTDILIRNVPDDVAEKLSQMASLNGQDRQAYLRQAIIDLAGSDWIPTRWGEGYRALAPNGGRCTLRRGDGYIQAGASDLTQEEFDAYQRAEMLADPKNGSQWQEARKVLEDAGFEVFNI